MCSADMSPFCIQLRMGEGLQPGDHQEGVSAQTCTQFDFSPSNLEQLQEDDQETFRLVIDQESVAADVADQRADA